MSFWLQRGARAESKILPPQLSTGPRTGFGENFAAQWETMRTSFITSSRTNTYSEAYRPIVDQLNENLPTGSARFLDPHRPPGDIKPSEETWWLTHSESDRIGRIWDEIERRRAIDPGALPQVPASREIFERQIIENVLETLAEAADISERATGTGTAGGIAGALAGAMSDPVNLATLPIGAAASWGILKTALTEAAINAGIEVATFPAVRKWRDELGLGYSVDELGQNMMFAAGGGALLGGGIKALARVFKPADDIHRADKKKILELYQEIADEADARTRDADRPQPATAPADPKLQEFLDRARADFETFGVATKEADDIEIAIRENVGDEAANAYRSEYDRLVREAVEARQAKGAGGAPDARTRGAAQAAEREVEIEAAQPAADPGPGERGEHRARTDEALVAAEDGELPDVAPRPVEEAVPPADMEIHGNLDGVHFRFHPDELQVDAPQFQFKAGGDVAGVTDRLAGLGEWDPIKAGLIMVWEARDGTRFIADGHQRLGLARALMKDDPSIRLYGFLVREADGVTAANARELAAVKNIAEGSGTATDAAKILRMSPERLKELPLTSGLVRVARDLVNLEDDAFMMVVNEIVPVNYAALVGRLAADKPELQGQILGVLARLGPDNQTQAESIVRQALAAGTTRETQVNLFGEEDLAISLFAERARVLDKSLKKLRRDRTVFNVLVGESSKIEEAGNRLAGDVNARRARTDGEAIETLQKLAHRKGPISDALNDAAERARSGDEPGAVDGFVQRLRDFAGDGTLTRFDDGPRPRGRDADPQAGARTAADPDVEAVEDFAEPAGPGQAAQADRIEADVRREIEGEAPEADSPDPASMAVFRDEEKMLPGNVVSITYGARDSAGRVFADIDATVRGDELRIEDIVAGPALIAGGRPQQRIGRAMLLRIAAELIRDNPGVTRITGERVSGIRFGGASVRAGEGAEASISANRVLDMESRLGAATDEGGQRVIPGAERISDRERAERGMEAPLRPAAAQAEEAEGLFDVAGQRQVDLEDLQVPGVARLDDEGQVVMEVRTARDLLDEIESDNDFVDALDIVCGPKRGKT